MRTFRGPRFSPGAWLWRCVISIVLCSLAGAGAFAQPPQAATQNAGLPQIRTYIENAWATLTRSPSDCKTVIDGRNPKNSILYFPADMQPTAEARALEQQCGIHIRQLPAVVHKAGDLAHTQFANHGLLYLPNAYVVPGGFLNEMYGWDSYFILVGLLQDHKTTLARGMVDNFLFEIEHYGAILNANRTYFLTRSQPPFLTPMIMAVHAAQKAEGIDDSAWLARAYPFAVRDYEMWTTAPHLAGETTLSRYFDLGEGPVPEIVATHDDYYRQVASHLGSVEMGSILTPAAAKNTPAEWPRYSAFVCDAGATPGKSCAPPTTLAFTEDYYKGDRSDRESGFDITFRFGPFAGETHHYAAVCLNSLLFMAENNLAELSTLTGHPEDTAKWKERAESRRAAVNKYLWDEQAGMYFDYDFDTKRRNEYVYATMLWPLWAGLASPEQARVVDSQLKLLERMGGLSTSNTDSGLQWDLPYGWAPLQLPAVEGLRKYGFDDDANRLTVEWLATVLRNFRRDGTIREKYNVVTGGSEFKVSAGYRANVVGFGWTNGVFLQLLSELPQDQRSKIEAAAAHP